MLPLLAHAHGLAERCNPYLVARAGRDAREATALSAFVQTGGYLAAAVAPPLLGALRQATGGWTAPVAVVLAATVLLLLSGLVAAGIAGRRLAARAS